LGAPDSLGLHRTGNSCSDSETISLHLYCPPYVECRFRKSPEINACCNTAAGVPEEGLIPIVNCAQDYVRESDELNLVSSLKHRPLYSNFNQLAELLRAEIRLDGDRHSPEVVEHIKGILRLMQFNPKYARVSYACSLVRCVAVADRCDQLLFTGNGANMPSSSKATTLAT